MNARNLVRVDGTDRVFHRYKILIVLFIPLGMALMAVSSVNVALPAIETGLGATDSDLQWVLAGYALMFGLSLIPAGRTGDVLGRGTVFTFGLGVFSLASLLCGLAPGPGFLNALRLLQGVGAGMINPSTIGIIQQYFSGGGRARAFALLGVVVSASVAVGPILAGLIIGALGPELGWRGTFIINFPIGLIGILLALKWLPFETERRRAIARKSPDYQPAIIDLDPIGAILLAAVVLSAMLPFMGRSTGPIWVLPVVAAALLAVWVRWERHYQGRGRPPLVNLDLFRVPSFSLGSAIGGTYFLGAASVFVAIALFLQTGLGISALDTGLVGLPNTVVSALASLIAGRYALRHGRPLIVMGQAAFIAGLLGVAGLAPAVASGASFWWLALPLCFIGFGAGMVSSCNQTLAMQDIPPEHGGTAGGIKSTAERIGTAIGNAVITAVLFATVAASGWTAGFITAVLTIAALMGLSTAFGVVDWVRAARQRVHQPTNLAGRGEQTRN